MKNVALIFGGKSGEHYVSIKTAFSISQSMDYTKYKVTPVYITLEGKWLTKEAYTQQPANSVEFEDMNTYTVLENFVTFFANMDVAFPAIHGPNGEDGTLQGFLELMDIPYVGSGVASSAMGMDKILMKTVFQQYGIPQGLYMNFERSDIKEREQDILMSIEQYLTYPMFVKPANLGSSVGISKVRNTSELKQALHFAARFDKKVLVEEFIKGRELEIGVLGNKEVTTSEIGEVTTTKDFYDYQAKYEDQNVTQLHIPAPIPQSVKERMQEIAKKTFLKLECKGLSRIDFFWDEEKDALYVNEINTLPGFTPSSMYPMLFKEVGISYSTLIDSLISFGFETHKEKKENEIITMQTK